MHAGQKNNNDNHQAQVLSCFNIKLHEAILSVKHGFPYINNPDESIDFSSEYLRATYSLDSTNNARVTGRPT